jgi:hypothetical protein
MWASDCRPDQIHPNLEGFTAAKAGELDAGPERVLAMFTDDDFPKDFKRRVQGTLALGTGNAHQGTEIVPAPVAGQPMANAIRRQQLDVQAVRAGNRDNLAHEAFSTT